MLKIWILSVVRSFQNPIETIPSFANRLECHNSRQISRYIRSGISHLIDTPKNTAPWIHSIAALSRRANPFDCPDLPRERLQVPGKRRAVDKHGGRGGKGERYANPWRVPSIDHPMSIGLAMLGSMLLDAVDAGATSGALVERANRERETRLGRTVPRDGNMAIRLAKRRTSRSQRSIDRRRDDRPSPNGLDTLARHTLVRNEREDAGGRDPTTNRRRHNAN